MDLHEKLGLLAEPVERVAAAAEAERDGWLEELERVGALGARTGGVPDRAALGLHRFLALTPAKLLGVWLPDTVGDRRPQNLPGTVDEYPNWRLPIADPEGRPLTLEELAVRPGPVSSPSSTGTFPTGGPPTRYRRTAARRRDLQRFSESF